MLENIKDHVITVQCMGDNSFLITHVRVAWNWGTENTSVKSVQPISDKVSQKKCIEFQNFQNQNVYEEILRNYDFFTLNT